MKANQPPQQKREPKTKLSALRLEVREGTQELIGIVSPHETALADIDLLAIRQHLHQEGFGAVLIDDPTLIDLLRRLRRSEAGESVLGVIEPGLSFALDYDTDSGTLFAVLEPCAVPPLLTVADLQAHIHQAGYENFKVNEADLAAVVTHSKQKKAGRYALGKRPEYTHISFRFEETSDTLFANLVAGNDAADVSPSAIQTQLQEHGFGDFFFEEFALNTLSEHANKNARGEFPIGERRDASISIHFDDELMSAYITTRAPAGGATINRAMLDKALDDALVYRQCCNSEAIDKVLSEVEVDNLLFASGTLPVDGVDAKFEALISEVQYSTPKESKSGKIDLREIVSFTLIDENTPVMRRSPPKAGVNGRNVKGEVIFADEALDTPFREKLTGVAISDSDPNILISTCKGHPVILANGVNVDNVITVNNVDMSTGNLNYDGSVLVKGEVRPGMRLTVTGDIVVKGVVTKAFLQAKNNIIIECGVIGSDPDKDGEKSPPAIIKSGGNVNAQYLHQAEIYTGGDVSVREYASHCKIEAKNLVLAGQAGGKGKIFGGNTYARAGVHANSLGASGDIKTSIYAGYSQEQQKQFEQLIESYDNRCAQEKKLSAMQKKYSAMAIQNPTEIKAAQNVIAIKKVLKDLKMEISKMKGTIKKINANFKTSKKAEVRVRTATYPNVSISINGASFNIRQESKGGIFAKSGNDIRWMNYRKK